MSIANIDNIRKLFSEVTGTDYTIKIVKRGEFDPRLILNPFTLPKTESSQTEATQTQETEIQNIENKGTDKFDNFFDKYSEIITDGDRQSAFSEVPAEVGEQSVIDDDREEFLDESEIFDDNDENL